MFFWWFVFRSVLLFLFALEVSLSAGEFLESDFALAVLFTLIFFSVLTPIRVLLSVELFFFGFGTFDDFLFSEFVFDV